MRLFPELATCHDVSIPELLASRDERQARQRAWLTRHATPLVSFTVVAPGPIKDSALTRRIFNHGVTALHTLAEEYGWTIREQAALVSASSPSGPLRRSNRRPSRLNSVIHWGACGISMS